MGNDLIQFLFKRIAGGWLFNEVICLKLILKSFFV